MSELIYTKAEPIIGKMSAVITFPKDFDKEKESLPLILFLHGAGEVGDGSEKTIDKVRVHGVPKYFSKDNDFKGLRVITVSPQCIDGCIWDQLTLQLKDFIDTVVDEFNADKSRIAVTGISMGGFGTWNMLTTYPDYFYRAAPICGGGVAWRINEKLKDKKIRVYHSVDDDAVAFTYSVLMVQKARKCGIDIEFTSYCNEGHGCWNRAYEEGDLIEWLAGEEK